MEKLFSFSVCSVCMCEILLRSKTSTNRIEIFFSSISICLWILYFEHFSILYNNCRPHILLGSTKMMGVFVWQKKISISQAFSLLPFFACLIQLIHIYVVIFNTGRKHRNANTKHVEIWIGNDFQKCGENRLYMILHTDNKATSVDIHRTEIGNLKTETITQPSAVWYPDTQPHTHNSMLISQFPYQ